MSMSAPRYTGDAAGALKKTAPIVNGMQGDAQLYLVAGNSIDTTSGTTDSGDNGGQWEIFFYSPSVKKIYKGVFSSDVGHVACQEGLKEKVEPVFQPEPQNSSSSVFATAFDRVVEDIKKRDPKLRIPARSSASYGKVALGTNEPRTETWLVVMGPWSLLVDDASGEIEACSYSGSACK
jgi:hypothetical protein